MNLGKRIEARLLELGQTQSWLSQRAGVDEGTISALIQRDSARSMFAPSLALALGVTTDWLLNGSEPKLLATPELIEDKAPYQVESDKYVTVQKLDNALGAGGVTLSDFDEVNGSHAFRRDWLQKKGWRAEDLRVLDVTGNSQSPYINDGDVVLVNITKKKIIDGEYYAIRIGEEARVKRLFRQLDGRIRVESLNAPVDFITPDTQAEIMGMVVHRAG